MLKIVKIVKTASIVLALVCGLLATVLAVVAATFDPNHYKSLIIRLVQEKKQRTLNIPGQIKLTFFPRIGADLGRLDISERGAPGIFASIEHARVSLALLPLLSRRLVVDRIIVDGLHANLRRNRDGSLNIDDLLSKEESGAEIRFDIDGVQIKQGQIVFDDRQEGRKLGITDLHLETGRLADGADGKFEFSAMVKNSRPAVDARVVASSGFRFALAKRRYALRGLDATLKGGSFGLAEAQLTFKGDVACEPKAAGALTGQPAPMVCASPRLGLAFEGSQDGQKFGGTLSTPLTVDLQTRKIFLPTIAAALTLPNPGGGMLKWQADGRAESDLGRQTATAVLKGKFDDSSFDARLGLTGFAPPAFTFDIGIDRIDVDRYRRHAAVPVATAATTAAAADKPFDLSILNMLNANGAVRIGALKVHNLKLTQLHVGVRAAKGRAELKPLSANLYGGSAAGALSAAATEPPQFTAQQTLSGIDVGALLKDAFGQDFVDGRGDLQLGVSTAGATSTQLRHALAGSARLALHDGAVRGINIVQAIRAAKAKIGAAQQGISTLERKTDFSELRGSFRIAHGVAHNEDLSIKSPLLRIGGAGDIDLGAERLDYLVKATVVSSLEGQGGPELQALNGLTIPVRLFGPLQSITWKIDFAGLASAAVHREFEGKKEEAKKKLQDQLQDGLKGLFGH